MNEMWTLARCREAQEHVIALRQSHLDNCQTCLSGGSDDCPMLASWNRAVNTYETLADVAEFMDGLEGTDDGAQG
jgi:hypothetical protein